MWYLSPTSFTVYVAFFLLILICSQWSRRKSFSFSLGLNPVKLRLCQTNKKSFGLKQDRGGVIVKHYWSYICWIIIGLGWGWGKQLYKPCQYQFSSLRFSLPTGFNTERTLQSEKIKIKKKLKKRKKQNITNENMNLIWTRRNVHSNPEAEWLQF